MNWNEYRTLSEKTMSTEFHCGRQVENLLHGVSGILTELDELLNWGDESNKKEEVADRLLGSLQVDSSKIRQMLDWTPPYTVDQGLQATADWFKSR